MERASERRWGTALAEPKRPAVAGGEDCSTFNSAWLELNKFRSQVEAKRRAVNAALAKSGKSLPARSYVPISHDAKYFLCSFVSRSISTPIPASFSLAISLSISAGTGYTFFSSFWRCFTRYSALKA